MTAVLVEAIKEQQLQIESLQEKNKSSETNIQEMSRKYRFNEALRIH
ncbi:MAG: hypothetical protein R2753_10675 [Chitinophagales bacterium]